MGNKKDSDVPVSEEQLKRILSYSEYAAAEAKAHGDAIFFQICEKCGCHPILAQKFQSLVLGKKGK